MKRFLVFLPLLMDTWLLSNAQWGHDRIYVGEITHRTKGEYLQETKKAYGIDYINDIGKSPYAIEITLSEISLLGGGGSYTRLYLDTLFKLSYQKEGLRNDGSYYMSNEIKSISTSRADSLFKVLVNNGIFSLPLLSPRAIIAEANAQILTVKGFEKDDYFVVHDGVEYILTYKVGDNYGQLIFNNPESYAERFPDNAVFRRQAEIVRALMSVGR